MKTITQNVTVEVKQTQVLGFHRINEDLDVQPDNKKIIAKVESFLDEASASDEGAKPLQTSTATIDMIDGEADAVTVDNYVAANLATILGGTTEAAA